MPIDTVVNALESLTYDSLPDWVQLFTALLVSAHDIARARIGVSQDRNAILADQNRRFFSCAPYDLVKIREYAYKAGKADKVGQRYSVPWRVIKKLFGDVFELTATRCEVVTKLLISYRAV